MLRLLINMSCDEWQRLGFRMDKTLFKFAITDLKFRNPKTLVALERILVDGSRQPDVLRELKLSRSTIEDAKRRLLRNLDERAEKAGIVIRSSVAVDKDHLNMVDTIHSLALAPHIVEDKDD